MRLLKWLLRIIGVGFICLFCVAAFGSYRGGYLSLPVLKDGEYPISFKSGLRAIVIDVEVPTYRQSQWQYGRRLTAATPDRRYIGVPYQVASWFEDTWSYCQKPSDLEAKAIRNSMPQEIQTKMTGSRLDAVCTIESDGETIPRGLIFSVPK